MVSPTLVGSTRSAGMEYKTKASSNTTLVSSPTPSPISTKRCNQKSSRETPTK
ncbi:unnamed protein product, partial [Allacma fusca]